MCARCGCQSCIVLVHKLQMKDSFIEMILCDIHMAHFMLSVTEHMRIWDPPLPKPDMTNAGGADMLLKTIQYMKSFLFSLKKNKSMGLYLLEKIYILLKKQFRITYYITFVHTILNSRSYSWRERNCMKRSNKISGHAKAHLQISRMIWQLFKKIPKIAFFPKFASYGFHYCNEGCFMYMVVKYRFS